MNCEESINDIVSSLRKAIELDPRFFLETKKDPIFLSLKNKVNDLLNKMFLDAQNGAEQRYLEVYYFISKIDFNWNIHDPCKSKFEKDLSKIRSLLAKSGYCEYLEAERLSSDVLKSAHSYLDKTLKIYQKRINELGTEISNHETKISNTKDKMLKEYGFRELGCGFGVAIAAFILIMILGAIFGPKYLPKHPTGFQASLVFLIPLFVGIFVSVLIFVLKKHNLDREYLPIVRAEETQLLKLEEEKKQALAVIENITLLNNSAPSCLLQNRIVS